VLLLWLMDCNTRLQPPPQTYRSRQRLPAQGARVLMLRMKGHKRVWEAGRLTPREARGRRTRTAWRLLARTTTYARPCRSCSRGKRSPTARRACEHRRAQALRTVLACRARARMPLRMRQLRSVAALCNQESWHGCIARVGPRLDRLRPRKCVAARPLDRRRPSPLCEPVRMHPCAPHVAVTARGALPSVGAPAAALAACRRSVSSWATLQAQLLRPLICATGRRGGRGDDCARHAAQRVRAGGRGGGRRRRAGRRSGTLRPADHAAAALDGAPAQRGRRGQRGRLLWRAGRWLCRAGRPRCCGAAGAAPARRSAGCRARGRQRPGRAPATALSRPAARRGLRRGCGGRAGASSAERTCWLAHGARRCAC